MKTSKLGQAQATGVTDATLNRRRELSFMSELTTSMVVEVVGWRHVTGMRTDERTPSLLANESESAFQSGWPPNVYQNRRRTFSLSTPANSVNTSRQQRRQRLEPTGVTRTHLPGTSSRKETTRAVLGPLRARCHPPLGEPNAVCLRLCNPNPVRTKSAARARIRVRLFGLRARRRPPAKTAHYLA